MTEVRYRHVQKEDYPEMAEVFLESIGDLRTRYSLSMPAPPLPAILGAVSHAHATGIYHLAELDDQIVAIACGIVRDHIFFLNTFWARPNQQRKGIGMPLLRRVLNAGKEAGATIFCVHSSMDTTAMAAYMKMGMLPGHQILYFGGKPERLPSTPSGYEVAPLEKHVAMEIDQEIRGTGREPDHEFWLGSRGVHGRQVLHDGNIVGYFYHGMAGIGPAAWTRPRDAKAMMNLACREATVNTPETRFSVPGVNHAALQFAFESGMWLTTCSHFLTTAPFGRMEQYIPSGPSLY